MPPPTPYRIRQTTPCTRKAVTYMLTTGAYPLRLSRPARRSAPKSSSFFESPRDCRKSAALPSQRPIHIPCPVGDSLSIFEGFA